MKEVLDKLVMQQYLVARFGKGRWSLCVDIDELFDYPYSGRHRSQLISRLPQQQVIHCGYGTYARHVPREARAGAGRRAG